MKKILERVKAKMYSILFWQSKTGEYLNKRYDMQLFFKYSFSADKAKTKQGEVASLTKDYHIVEKGLALPATRTEFGKERIPSLIEKANKYRNIYGDDELINSIQESLFEYLEFNRINGVNLETPFFSNICLFVGNTTKTTSGGTKSILKKDVECAVNIDFENFLTSRSSIRDFDTTPLDINVVKEAINLARYTPSVCNRQSWRAHLYTNKKKVLEVLDFQNGHGGFKESIKGIIVITTDVSMFTTLESNQVFIDGGMFAMNLMLTLHHRMIGSCALNTCIPYVDEKALKKKIGIDENERVIMMIAIGNLKEKYKVAISQRRDLDEILIHHN